MVMRKISYILLVCGVLALMLPHKMEAETIHEYYFANMAGDGTCDMASYYGLNANKFSRSANMTVEAGGVLQYSANIRVPDFTATATLANVESGDYTFKTYCDFNCGYTAALSTEVRANVNFCGVSTTFGASFTGLSPSVTLAKKEYKGDGSVTKNGYTKGSTFSVTLSSGDHYNHASKQHTWRFSNFRLYWTPLYKDVALAFKQYDVNPDGISAGRMLVYHSLVAELRDKMLGGELNDGSRAPEVAAAYNAAKAGNIVVGNGKVLKFSGSGTYEMVNLTVKPAGKLVVTAPVVVTNDFILEGGLYDGVTHYSMPDAQIQKPMTVGAGHFKLKYTVDFTRFYFVSLPNDVDVANVTMEGEAMGVHPLFYKYDSQNRALNGKQNNWKVKSVDGTGTLEAGKGYIFSLEPSSTTATAVFPLDETLISGVNGNNIETSVSVEDFDGAGVSVYNKGWNLVGANGRIGAISSIDAALGVVRYVSIPHALDDSYEQLELSDGFEIPAFSSFFVQVNEDNTITFPVSGALAPRRIAEETDERMARITLTSGEGDSDHMGVLVTEEATTDYNVGLDLTKMYGNSQATLCYTLIGANKLAYNALPQVAASNIPVGYKTSLAGEYTFALKENSREGFLHVWLSDTEENTTVDLLEGAYVFTTEATTNNTRFLLSCVTDAPTIATGVENVSAPIWLTTEGELIRLYGVAENALVSVYDAAGRMVQQMHVNGEDTNIVVPGEGLYVVRVQTNNAMMSLKAMVK